MAKKLIALCLGFALAFTLCGCSIFTSDTAELLSPPGLSGDFYPISQAIKADAGSNYTLQYPTRGDYRSAVILKDVNGDGTTEAFAFYSTTDGETITMNMNVVRYVDEEWKSISVQKIVAGGVDKIDFCDLNNDGIEEIIVGWAVYGSSETQLGVYSIGLNSSTQRMLQKYTHYMVCDLDANAQNEILLIKAFASEQSNSASLVALSDEGITEVSTCQLDSTVTSISEPVLSTLSNGKQAVYLDEIKGVGAITEVLMVEKGELVNPLYDPVTKETNATLRSINFLTTDINSDGVLEIPVQQNVPSVTISQVTEKLYLTNWASFNGEKLVTQMTAMINTADGYYYVVPTKWVGKIAILKDTENGIREIYTYDEESMTVGENLIIFRTVKTEEWQRGDYDTAYFAEIGSWNGKTVICHLYDGAVLQSMTYEDVIENFNVWEGV